MAAIEARALTKRYGDFTAVDGLSVEVDEGEVFGFLGPNGAGKTTSIRMMAGLARPSSGEVWIEGKRVEGDGRATRGRMGL